MEIMEYSNKINEELSKGILLNTNGDKFNSMVIAWGHLGIVWGLETFVIYVKNTRYTKSQLDKTKEFTLSIPLDTEIDKEVFNIFGTMSGRDIDKEKYVTLNKARTINTPGIKEYPLTIECKVIYSQDQVVSNIPDNIVNSHYKDGSYHTMYIGKIVDAYIIE